MTVKKDELRSGDGGGNRAAENQHNVDAVTGMNMFRLIFGMF